MKNKLRGLITLLIFLMLVTLIPYNAGATTYETNFESINIQADFQGSVDNAIVWHTPAYHDNCDITSDYEWGTNIRTLKGRTHQNGDTTVSHFYINSTLQYLTYIGTIDIYFYINDVGQVASSRVCDWYFYNYTGGVETQVLHLRFEKADDTIKVYDVLGATHTLVDLSGIGVANHMTGYYNIEIRHLSGNNMNYSIYNSTNDLIGSVDTTSRHSSDWTNATNFYFDGEGGSGGVAGDYMDFYFDTIIYDTYSGASSGGVLETCNDDTIGTIIGGASSTISGGTTYPFLATVYNIKTTGTIDTFYLAMHELMGSQYGYGGTVLSLKINEMIHGSPSTVYEIDGSNMYIAEWNGLNQSVENTELYIGVFQQGFTNPQWNVFYSNQELQGDGEQFHYFFTQSQGGAWWNGGAFHQLPTPTAYGRRDNMDLQYMICIDVEPPDLQDFTNTVHVTPSTVTQYESVDITYLVNGTSIAMGYQAIVNVITPSTSIPYYLTRQNGHFLYTPTATGSYGVNLTVNGVNVSYDTFTCTGTLDDWIYTVENPSGNGETFTIYYNYSSTHDGEIELLDQDFETVTTWGISPQTENGTIPTSIVSSGVYYLLLKALPTNYSEYTLYAYTHFVSGGLSPVIAVNPSYCQIGESVEISGHHSHLGQDVRVRIGNTEIPVGNTEYFDIDYETIAGGDYTVTLNLYLGNQRTILASDTLQVYGVEQSGYTEEEEEMRLYIGIGIILAFSFVGVGIMTKMKQESAIMIPFFFGLIGAIISTLLELTDMWIIFVIGIFIIGYIVYGLVQKKTG